MELGLGGEQVIRQFQKVADRLRHPIERPDNNDNKLARRASDSTSSLGRFDFAPLRVAVLLGNLVAELIGKGRRS